MCKAHTWTNTMKNEIADFLKGLCPYHSIDIRIIYQQEITCHKQL